MAGKPVKAHSRLAHVEAVGMEMRIGDATLSELVARASTTPFYAYDREFIDARIRSLSAALPTRLRLVYSIKANPMAALVGHLRNQVGGFDVASLGEMQIALNAGMPAQQISFTGPGKQLAELRAALGAGIALNVESELEIERIANIARESKMPARIAIRVNPKFELKGSGMKMSGKRSQFGIDAERVPSAVAQAQQAGLLVEGFHIFCGSQNLHSGHVIEANRATLTLAAELSERCNIAPKRLNIGGGYGIPYFPGDPELDITPIGEALADCLMQLPKELTQTEISIELGRYIVGEAGYYVTRVSDLKRSGDTLLAVVDGGLHHHLANSGNFGQVLRKNYPVVIGNKINVPGEERVSIVGPLCTPLDIVADDVMLPKIEIGDLVVVMQSGAYGFSASPHGFLGHPPPVELLV